MSEWHCQVVRIESKTKHPDADSLSIFLTTAGNYPVIDKTSSYNVGDLACYLSIDTIVPSTEMFHFLCPRDYIKVEENGKIVQKAADPKYKVGEVPEKNRVIKAKRLRGIFSCGLLIPIPFQDVLSLSEGDDITDLFGLTKYEEIDEEDICPTKKEKIRQQNESKPIGWSIPYYDIDSFRKYGDLFQVGEEIVISEKINGCNASYAYDSNENKLYVKSRNYFKRTLITAIIDGVPQTILPTDLWTTAARNYNLEEKLASCPNIVLFGEVYGQVGRFPYNSSIIDGTRVPKLRFFEAYDPYAQRYLDYDDFLSICRNLNLDTVPELYRGPYVGRDHVYPFAEGKSTLNDKHIREGCVIRPAKYRYEPKLNGRLLLKLLGEGYVLSK
jgi:RNA ligase (TIGR02306 family)